MAKEISRRSFLKGAAAGALTAALAGATNGIAFAEEKPAEAVPEEQSSTWYDAKYFAKPDPITDIAETIDTDVVVVGAGNGGLVAAASVVDLGAKLVLVEKNAMPISWAGEMGAYNTKLMKEKYGIEYTEEEMLEISNEICRYAGYECDQRLINLWLFNSGRTMDWFIDQMETKGVHMFLETDMKDCRFMNKPQTHTVYETFEELGPNYMGSQLANPSGSRLSAIRAAISCGSTPPSSLSRMRTAKSPASSSKPKTASTSRSMPRRASFSLPAAMAAIRR